MKTKDALQRWEGQVEEFKMSLSYEELLGVDGELTEFEWNIFQRIFIIAHSSRDPE